jgi:hypothetical protein
MTAQLDLSATSQVPFTRLVAVELRKARDTRPCFWLLLAIGLVVVLLLGTATRHHPWCSPSRCDSSTSPTSRRT